MAFVRLRVWLAKWEFASDHGRSGRANRVPGMSTLASSRVQKSVAPEGQAFSIRLARLIIGDLFVRRPGIYVADLLITLAIGYPCVIYFMMPGWHWTQVLAFIVGGLALFRAGSFIHEIVHMGQGAMTRFKVMWNLCCGIPMLMPSFLYECHIDHHAVPHYGTGRDGEYLPLGRGPLRRLFGYLFQIAVLPALAFFRFFLLTPISFLHPKLRRWVLENASSYVMNPEYKRELQPGQPHAWWGLGPTSPAACGPGRCSWPRCWAWRRSRGGAACT